MDLLPYVVDLMLEVADLNLMVPDLRSGEIRLTLTPWGETSAILRMRARSCCLLRASCAGQAGIVSSGVGASVCPVSGYLL